MCAKIAYRFWKKRSTVSEKPKTVRAPVNIVAVAESMREAPSTSIHHYSQQLNISETSLRRILHKDLALQSPIDLGAEAN